MRGVVNIINTAKLVKKDFILIAALTFIYSIIALMNLGSTKVPQSFWHPASVGENFYVDLGENKDIERISYYVGLDEQRYYVSFSKDKITWTGKTLMKPAEVFRWNIVDVSTNSRYVKFEVGKSGGMLGEIGIFEKGKGTSLSIVSLTNVETSSKGQGNPQMLFDEQEYVEKNHSYLTSTYFDEVYHARTAYETIHKIEPYEWTHPPLGKIFIALGVSILGMNPLGWRIIGTLFGIAMVPCMYILGKRLFKKTGYAFLTAFLMAFDFMHFTQTRIATVDVYAVFFIILMYYFMYKFTEVKPSREGLKKSIIQLALSGLFFALGVASKWISLYAAVGLAVLFFKEIYDRYIEYKDSVKYLTLDTATEDIEKYKLCRKIKNTFRKHTVKTIAWAVVFFIIVPLVVYIMSYIPFMMIPGPGHGLKDVLDYQQRMYKYHSGLVATHPYQSPWYQWPIMLRPMWYYSADKYLPGKLSNIVAMGNPAVWWIGIVTFISMVVVGVKKKDKKAFFIIVGALSNYMPWMLISRIVFIYHYFATVPFIILSIVYTAAQLCEKKRSRRFYVYGYMILVVVLFVIFYPSLSGAVVDKGYAWGFLSWFEK